MGESRLPRNLQGLLRFCMQVGDDPQASPGAGPMDPERARWLREAMDSMTVDIGKRLKENIAKILQNADPAADGDTNAAVACLDCLEDTADLCENLDIANDFVKLGGLDVAAHVCQRYQGVSDEELQSSALHLMARLFQNNPFAQAAGIGCVRYLVTVVGNGSGGFGVRFAALSALSCLVRDCPTSLAACAEAGGPAAIAGCLRVSGAGGDRLRCKAAFLLASLAAESDENIDRLAAADGVLDALADSVSEEAAAADAKKSADDADAAAKLDWLEHAFRYLHLVLGRRAHRGLPHDANELRWRSRLAAALGSLRRSRHLSADRYPECVELLEQLLALLLADGFMDGSRLSP